MIKATSMLSKQHISILGLLWITRILLVSLETSWNNLKYLSFWRVVLPSFSTGSMSKYVFLIWVFKGTIETNEWRWIYLANTQTKSHLVCMQNQLKISLIGISEMKYSGNPLHKNQFIIKKRDVVAMKMFVKWFWISKM